MLQKPRRIAFPIDLGDGTWAADRPVAGIHPGQTWTLTGFFAIPADPEATRQQVWTGQIKTGAVQVRMDLKGLPSL